ncbi:Uncharacterised protein [Mycobacteroides abscessus subsp. abscessus]|nr:Uncharacterised protein [Mycobacteroides abscessus subsp. abscessus]
MAALVADPGPAPDSSACASASPSLLLISGIAVIAGNPAGAGGVDAGADAGAGALAVEPLMRAAPAASSVR